MKTFKIQRFMMSALLISSRLRYVYILRRIEWRQKLIKNAQIKQTKKSDRAETGSNPYENNKLCVFQTASNF